MKMEKKLLEYFAFFFNKHFRKRNLIIFNKIKETKVKIGKRLLEYFAFFPYRKEKTFYIKKNLYI